MSLFKDDDTKAIILASCVEAASRSNSQNDVTDAAKFALKLYSEVRDNFMKFEDSLIEDLNKE